MLTNAHIGHPLGTNFHAIRPVDEVRPRDTSRPKGSDHEVVLIEVVEFVATEAMAPEHDLITVKGRDLEADVEHALPLSRRFSFRVSTCDFPHFVSSDGSERRSGGRWIARRSKRSLVV